MIWLALALGCLGVGLGLVAVFGTPWTDSFRAHNWRRELEHAFSRGYDAAREDGKRMR